MALKSVPTTQTVEVRPRLTIRQASLDYARAYAEQKGRKLDDVLSQAIDQVCVPEKKKKEEAK